MPNWEIKYFPPVDERNSPYKYILDLADKKEQAQIIRRLAHLSNHELAEWPHTWIHKISAKILQLTAGNCRIMFCLDERNIIVLHACRKVKGKTRPRDKERAETNYSHYMAEKGIPAR